MSDAIGSQLSGNGLVAMYDLLGLQSIPDEH